MASEIIEVDLSEHEKQAIVIAYLHSTVDSSSFEVLEEYISSGQFNEGVMCCILNAAVVNAIQAAIDHKKDPVTNDNT